MLLYASACCRANGGTPGVHGPTFADSAAYGLAKGLGERAEARRGQTDRPQAVRRAPALRGPLPKPDGKHRPLGIPTVQDRGVQTAALVVLEPIVEADLQPEQYA